MQMSKNPKKKKKTKKGHCLTMLGIAGGEQGNPMGLKKLLVSLGANVMADANFDVDRTQGSWATTP